MHKDVQLKNELVANTHSYGNASYNGQAVFPLQREKQDMHLKFSITIVVHEIGSA